MGVALLVLAVVVGVSGRRRASSIVLAFFLLLVALNFIASSLLESAKGESPRVLGEITLALDPFYFVLFITAFPYERRSRTVKVLLGSLGVTALGAIFLIVFYPSSWTNYYWSPGAPFPPPLHTIIVLELAVAYGAGWFLSLETALQAPTPLLARRAGWLAAAVGITVVPRLALVPLDLVQAPGASIATFFGVRGNDPVVFLVEFAVQIVLMVLIFGLGLWRVGRTPSSARKLLEAPLRLIPLVIGSLVIAGALFEASISIEGRANAWAAPYAFRWIVFAAILIYGILAYEVVEFKAASERVFPTAVGLIGASTGFLATAGFLGARGVDGGLVLTVAFGVALAASVPSGVLALFVVRRIRPIAGGTRNAERRLELYRAALESAWARGPPSEATRRRLDRDRRAFGVSVDEGRALEHVVATAITARGRPLATGDEPVPGLIVERLLGEGAHGRIHLAVRSPTGARVVLKELRVEEVDAAGTRRRLLRETRPLMGFSHANVVRFLGVHFFNGRPLLEMEYVDGESLRDELARGPLRPMRVRPIMDDILSGLGAAHERGVIHLDVKPANILIGRDGSARLADFGIARFDDGGGSIRATVTNFDAVGHLEGTLGYMTPEQAQGLSTDPRTDLYAVGLVLYEALTGRSALDIRGLGLADALERVAHPTVDLEVAPAEWRAFLARAIDPDPAGRFQTAKEMRAALPPEP